LIRPEGRVRRSAPRPTPGKMSGNAKAAPVEARKRRRLNVEMVFFFKRVIG